MGCTEKMKKRRGRHGLVETEEKEREAWGVKKK